jgi:ribosomal protein S18 acetylase RimI-like enzyme
MSRCEIRPIEPGEVEAVVRLWRRAREDAQPWLEARMSHTAGDDRAFFRGTILRQTQVLVALRDERPVGMLAIAGHRIEHLYVDPPAQGQGVGTALLEHARRRSPSGLSLHTHQRNQRARAFYERRGFRVVRFGVSAPPESEPDVEYHWRPDGSD